MAVEAVSPGAAMEFEIRQETLADVEQIAALHRSSFPSDSEARLVDELRRRGELICSVVAVAESRVVAHAAFSEVRTASGSSGIGLGPIATRASNRRAGIAAKVVQTGIDLCRARGYRWGVVLGDPGYYGRFGFQPAISVGIQDEYGGGAAFQVLALVPDGLPVNGGLVRYSSAFEIVAA